jgi:hypothetical protein
MKSFLLIKISPGNRKEKEGNLSNTEKKIPTATIISPMIINILAIVFIPDCI